MKGEKKRGKWLGGEAREEEWGSNTILSPLFKKSSPPYREETFSILLRGLALRCAVRSEDGRGDALDRHLGQLGLE